MVPPAGISMVGSSVGSLELLAGSSGLGDPFFPNGGNGGYVVAHYDLKLAYDPGTDVLDGNVVVTATACALLGVGGAGAGASTAGVCCWIILDLAECKLVRAAPIHKQHNNIRAWHCGDHVVGTG